MVFTLGGFFAPPPADDGSNAKIAIECGFSSATHFEQAFKKVKMDVLRQFLITPEQVAQVKKLLPAEDPRQQPA
ncbi:MAG: hypothetical protein WEB60_06555 [Terrimicrobiaceae bacterium]